MSAGAVSIQSPAVVPAGVMVTLYAPNGELITVQQTGEPGQQRWALSSIRAHTQEDAPLGGQSFDLKADSIRSSSTDNALAACSHDDVHRDKHVQRLARHGTAGARRTWPQ